jgi:uncharacterized protein YjbI with pentapeptide repeats
VWRLSGADSSGADLSDANLSGSDPSGACYDQSTIWPDEILSPAAPPLCDQ